MAIDILERQIDLALQGEISLATSRLRRAASTCCASMVKRFSIHVVREIALSVRLLEAEARDESERRAFAAVLGVLAKREASLQKKLDGSTPAAVK